MNELYKIVDLLPSCAGESTLSTSDLLTQNCDACVCKQAHVYYFLHGKQEEDISLSNLDRMTCRLTKDRLDAVSKSVMNFRLRKM